MVALVCHPEEGLVFFDWTAKRSAPQPVEEIVRRPLERALLNVAMAVILVASGFHRGVEYAATRSAHFRVVGVDLDLDLRDRVDVWDKDRTVSQVRFRHSIEQVVIAPDRATTQR